MSVKIGGNILADIGVYINLDRRQDRNEYFKNQLLCADVKGVKRRSANDSQHGGVSGLIETTFNIYNEFLKTGKETMVIFEDDCKFLNTFKDNSKQICEDISNIE